MKKNHFLAIVPNEGMREIFYQVQKEMSEAFELTVKVAVMSNIAPYLNHTFLKQFDAILTRGGTATLLRHFTYLPVIDISVSGYDYISTIMLAQIQSQKIAIVGFENMISNASAACDFFGTDIRIVTISDYTQLPEILTGLKSSGYTTVIGGTIAVKSAQKLGLYGIQLTSGRESVRRAIEDASYVVQMNKRWRERDNFMRESIDKIEEPVAIIANDGEILACSQYFPQQLLSDISAEALKCIFAQDSDTITLSNNAIDNFTFKSTVFIGDSNSFAFLQLLDTTVSENVSSAIQLINEVPPSKPVLDSAFMRAQYLPETVDRALRFSIDTDSLILHGDVGLQKDVFAQAIHFSQVDTPGALLILNCVIATKEDCANYIRMLKRLCSCASVPTCYLREFTQLNSECSAYFTKVGLWDLDCKFILTATAPISQILHLQILPKTFMQKSSIIRIPSLQEHPQDIKPLVGVILTECNQQTGRRVIGIAEDALDVLQNYSWPGNITQLRMTILNLVKYSTRPYITTAMLDKELNATYRESPNMYVSVLNRTLDEIINESIRLVLLSEGMNQQLTAQKLGISRSTLWRRIKS